MSKLPDSALNFLATLHGQTREEALANVALEMRLSRWTVATARAVQLEVLKRYGRSR